MNKNKRNASPKSSHAIEKELAVVKTTSYKLYRDIKFDMNLTQYLVSGQTERVAMGI